MSKFNSYAKRLNEAAKEAFEEYRKAEKAYNAAEARRKGLPWNATAEEKTLADARTIEARNNLKEAQKVLASSMGTMNGIRGELVKALGDAYRANPEDIDPNTMELLKAGILKPAEYVDLANRAIASGNNTMLRVIGSYADGLNKDAYSLEDRSALQAVAHRAKTSTGESELERFDVLVETFSKCVNNPLMIDHWDALTQENIETF